MVQLSGYLFWGSCLVAVILHELAHIVMARIHGLQIKKIGITWKGPYIMRESGTDIANLHVSLAGPMVNLLLAFTFMTCPTFAVVNIILGIFNLPIPGSDGYRARACLKRIRHK